MCQAPGFPPCGERMAPVLLASPHLPGLHCLSTWLRSAAMWWGCAAVERSRCGRQTTESTSQLGMSLWASYELLGVQLPSL